MTTGNTRDDTGRGPAKVSIIGAGMVGASLAYSLIIEQLAGELVLVDIDRDRALGEAMDINHALPFSAPTAVRTGDYADCTGSHVIIITAGVAQKSGESRLELAERNVEIYRDIVPRVMDVVGKAVVLVVSNPVDVLTYATIRLSDLPPERVIGSGTVLDTARFRYELSAHCRVDPRNVHAYIVGEHGDSEVAVWSAANVAGVPFPDFCRSCGRGCSQDTLDEVFERVKNAAYEIIRLKGATYYAIALGAVRMIEAILRDQNTVMTASTLLQGPYGLNDVCLSVPVVLGRGGVQTVIGMPIDPAEQEALEHSAGRLSEPLEQRGLRDTG
jgi:L-lactate dehydrogenase